MRELLYVLCVPVIAAVVAADWLAVGVFASCAVACAAESPRGPFRLPRRMRALPVFFLATGLHVVLWALAILRLLMEGRGAIAVALAAATSTAFAASCITSRAPRIASARTSTAPAHMRRSHE